MTHALLPRSAWTSTGPIKSLTPLYPAEVRGLAVHWPGSPGRWGTTPTLEETARRLEDERRQHTSTSASDPSKPWSDIAYSLAVDLAGRLFDARGLRWRPAANGDADVNRRYVAVTVLMGADDPVTPAAVDAVRAARALVLQTYPHAVEVVGHRDLHQTECPGPGLYQLVRSGAFTAAPAAPAQEDDMPTADEVADAVLTRLAKAATPGQDSEADAAVFAVARRVWTVGWPAGTADDPKRQETAQDRLVWAARGSGVAGTLDTILGLLRTGGGPVVLADQTVAALADAIVHRLPGGQTDPAAVAAAVRAELAAALARQ